MSKSKPVSTKDRASFVEHMRAHDDGDPWRLLDAAEEFMILHRYRRGDPQSAVDQYKELRDVPPT